ncbi:DUF320 domain-containing protein [Streptomyces sp. BA2]|nr:DUF320 domain-containing protein [Streptomyces sp. BA2]
MRAHAFAAAVCMAVTGVLSGAGAAAAGAGAGVATAGSPGVYSGGILSVPVNVPVHLCGGNTNVVGLLNPSFGTACAGR